MNDVLKCIAVDDEPLALRVIESYAAKNESLQLLQTFEDAVSAAEYLRNAAIDLVFTDINMPDISGLDLVRSLEKKPQIIFTTAHKKFAFEGFEVAATDYLLKPISPERFAQAVEKACQRHRQKQPSADENFLFVRSEYRLVKIDTAAIDYIEGLEDYIRIHATGSKPLLTLMTLKSVMEKLPPDKFLRVHRSYIINLSRVTSFVNKEIMLSAGVTLPVSDTYVPALREWIEAKR